MHELLERFNNERKLKILLLEDSDLDAFLIQQFLEELEIPFQVIRVERKEEFVNTLINDSPDLILSDYNLPSIDGLEALELKKRYSGDIPFIFVTSSLREEQAVETLKKGAADFLLKENLVRLNTSIMSSLREAEVRKRRTEAEVALRESEAKYRQLIEQAADGIFITEESFHYLEVNTQAHEMLGYTQEEMLKMKLEDTLPPGTESPAPALKEMKVGEIFRYESRRKRKDGAVFPVEVSVSKISDSCYQGIMRDITQRKEVQHALEEALNKLEFYLRNSPLAILEIDQARNITRWSGQAEKIFGWTEEEVIGKPAHKLNLFHPEEREGVRAVFEKHFEEGVNNFVFPTRCYTKKGKMIYCETYHSISFDEQGQFHSLLSLANDVTVPKLEAEVRRKWREKERKRVAREIHEGIGQMLVASKFKAASIDVTAPDAVERISQVEDLLENAIEEVRRTSLNMAPRSVEELGIENAIRQLGQQMEETTGIQVSFLYTGHGKTAGNKVLSTIYRIVQEALNNVIRHSHASKVVVELKMDIEKAELKIEDNGDGFAVDKVDISKTGGLRNIKERVDILGGDFEITSDNRNGTKLKVNFPM